MASWLLGNTNKLIWPQPRIEPETDTEILQTSYQSGEETNLNSSHYTALSLRID